MLQIDAKILYNKRVKKRCFEMCLQAPQFVKRVSPGQFVNVRITDSLEPLLRRPFSVHRANEAGLVILYEVVGKGSEVLARKKPGEYMDMIGPLGQGFKAQGSEDFFDGHSIIVAGGMGAAPLVFLAERLAQRKNRAGRGAKCLALIGARTKDEVLCVREFRQAGWEVRVSTDDGSQGLKGRITDLLNSLLSTIDYRLSTIYACGPRPMLKKVSSISKDFGISAQVSLEAHMACGIGACLGCVVQTKQGFMRVCKEGPVFNADEITW